MCWSIRLRAAYLVLLAIIPNNAEDPTVDISTGKLVGSTVQFTHEDTQHTVHVYKGIPYAEPPIGDLRFRPPVPKSPWRGIYDAKYTRGACVQSKSPFFLISEDLTSEDCLFLNVFVPQSELKKYAVMVWIHGGGFSMGSSSPIAYDATPLAAINDVIVVSINYRLGSLGFLTTGDSAAGGNYGMLDQVEGLKWIEKNIKAFGGDADRVTIFGESAGSLSCHLHILSPLSSGLFHRAILQSGVISPAYGLMDDIETSVKAAYTLGKELGCEQDNSEDLVQCLRKVPVEGFVQASVMESVKAGTDVLEPFSPIVDEHFTPKDPFRKLSNGSFNKIDCIVGSMADEGMFLNLMFFPEANGTAPFVDKATFDAMAPMYVFPPNHKYPAIKDMAKYLYTDWEKADSADYSYLDALSQMGGDSFHVCPIDKCTRDLFNAGVDAYLYHFTHYPSSSIWKTTWLKAAHGEDIPYVFGYHFHSQLHPDSVLQFDMTDEESLMSLQIMKYLTNFAKTGDPNMNEDGYMTEINWPKFSVPELQYKELSPSMPTKRALKAKECAFWNQLQSMIRELTDEMKTKCGKE
ncbi:pyrethroid hydrolase Ces2a-like [Glandiceps talaboti]